ncbi:hypothetical protein RHMOL_Rhmol01G0297200 [Rhododendron molle]|uniref:Uncharacterized protein n=1 Tax=Rhododendron molle TaxID=49168 RepID=A0ACC0Q6S2_RHOML|nr:hypothetical protein RHMOL_Rhmol01G0297200 [Rhododendron molle]
MKIETKNAETIHRRRAHSFTDKSFSLSFGSLCWGFKPITKSRRRFCVSQERSIIELGNKQDKTTAIGKTRIVTEDCNGNPTSQKTLVDELPPLVSVLKSSAQQNAASFHFPGHNRGRAAPSALSHLIGEGPFLHDLPELP